MNSQLVSARRGWSAPVIRAFGIADCMHPSDFSVAELNVFQLREVRGCLVLAVMHVTLDVDDDRVFKFRDVVELSSRRC